MVTTVNTGARLDWLPISSFHYRIFGSSLPECFSTGTIST